MMKTLTLSLAILASTAALATIGLAAADQTQMTKQIDVRSAAQVKGAFDLAARPGGGKQAVVITCYPASSSWCGKNFVQACDNAKGGMSTNPDGSTSCTVQHAN
jgi:hypothetical protein